MKKKSKKKLPTRLERDVARVADALEWLIAIEIQKFVNKAPDYAHHPRASTINTVDETRMAIFELEECQE